MKWSNGMKESETCRDCSSSSNKFDIFKARYYGVFVIFVITAASYRFSFKRRELNIVA